MVDTLLYFWHGTYQCKRKPLLALARACARIMGQRLIGARLSDKGFTLPDVVLAYEAKFIVPDALGSVDITT
jgi:hypothetical protein